MTAQAAPLARAEAAPLTGRRALVTAGTSGIGRAVAEALRAHGADVFITGTSQAAESVAREIGASGFAVADFTQPRRGEQAVLAATEALGGLDVVVANTGGPRPSTFESLDDAAWLEAHHLILGSAVELARTAIPLMRQAGQGRIVFLTSTAGVVRPIPGLHLSNVMRAAVCALARSIAGELGPDGITVNVIAPGPTDTARRRQVMQFQADAQDMAIEDFEQHELAQVPVGRFGRPAEIGSLVAFLCSDAAGFITGTVQVIDGGFTLT